MNGHQIGFRTAVAALGTGACLAAPAGADTGFGPSTGRPFAATSAWNTSIPAHPVLDPRNGIQASYLSHGQAADLYEFGTPVFDGWASTARSTVTCTEPWGVCDLAGRPIPIPPGASPAPGSDGSMVVVDWPRRVAWDFWQARRTGPRSWSASWGTGASIDGDGRGRQGGATGAGVNVLAGLVRTFEIRHSAIDHALVFSTDNSCRRVFRYPATKTDGGSARLDCIPEGARVQLDPTIDLARIPGITRGELTVGRALQRYGAFNRDNGGARMALAFENPAGETDPYPAAGFAWDYYDMPHIPWTRLRVLRAWDGR